MIELIACGPSVLSAVAAYQAKPRLIAFCGPATVGKTTAAKVLVRQSWNRMSFADPLRDMLRALGVSDHYIYEDKTAPVELLCGKSARTALQSLGTEWGRGMIGDAIWLNAARHRITNACGRVVIDDVRFDNEAKLIRELGGWLVELSRPDCFYSTSHESEKGVSPDLFTHRIHAIDTDELEEKVLDLIGERNHASASL